MSNDPKSFLSTDGLQALIANIKASLGATDYDDLSDKPKLNNVTVQGNKTSTDFGLQDKIDSSHKLNADLIDDSESINKFVTAAEKTAWNKSVSYMSIPNSGDLNNYYGAENAGNYLCTDANVSTLSHKPSAITTAFRMDVIFYNDQTIQVIYPNDEKCVSFLRIYKNNTWSEWKESAIEMTILSYGNSTWDDFMKAYLLNSIVYCRAGSSTPQTSPQLRLAFMAYVNNEANPTEVEFQYYRSVSNKSDSAQGDEVYVYKLNKTDGWSNLKRNAYSKVAVAAPITKSYASGTVTIGHANSGVAAGTYDSVTVDAKGHVTAGSNYTIDSTPTVNSTNLVTSGGVYTDQTRQDTVIGIVENKGAKNLLETTKVSQTINGVTFTVNGDGTVTIDTAGVASQDRAQFLLRSVTTYPGMQGYILSGAVQNNQDVQLRFQLGANPWTVYAADSGSGATISSYSDASLIQVYINVPAGVTVSNLVFKPMICTKAEWDISHEYVPYGKTNAELTAENTSQQAEINYAVNAGVKNLLPMTHTSGSITRYGVTCTWNDDGTMTLNGSHNSGDSASIFEFYDGSAIDTTVLPAGSYVITGCPAGGSTSTYRAALSQIAGAVDAGNGATFELSEPHYAAYRILISGNVTFNNMVFKPMIRPASITDSTFQPYALPNPTLTPAVIKAVDEGSKNKFTYGDLIGIITNFSDQTFFLPAGSYKLIFTASASTGVFAVRLKDAQNNSIYYITANNVAETRTYDLNISKDAEKITFYSSVSNDFTNIMICTAADYAISPTFVPYRPSYDNLVDEVSQLKNYIGYEKSWILGLQVDYQNKTFTRLGKAVDLTPGLDFNQFNIYNKRRRCNVSDDGTINAFYGESGYIEDGTNGQVMVYQPKFYYKVEPLKLESIVDGEGYHIRKANYYISETPRDGFKLHPAFKDENGNELEYYLIGAYEASLYDVSESIYILDDAQVADFSADKICSIANAKPISGLTQNLTRSNCEKLATNRGTRWHNMTIQIASAEQLLFMIEYGKMNAQETIGKGVVNKASGEGNESINTGSTSNLGNASGATSGTDGLVSIAYRGVENLWGNIWSWIDGVNIWGDGTKKGGIPYITNKLPFVENTKTDYNSAGFTTSGTNGYISAMGYGNPDYDWVFFASETTGNSTLPVGDYQYYTANLNGYRVAILGGTWTNVLNAGLFCWHLDISSSYRSRYIGGRGVIIPDINATNYWTNIRKAN